MFKVNFGYIIFKCGDIIKIIFWNIIIVNSHLISFGIFDYYLLIMMNCSETKFLLEQIAQLKVNDLIIISIFLPL